MASAACPTLCPCWNCNIPCPRHRQQPTNGSRLDMPLAVDTTLEYELDLSQFQGLNAEGNVDPNQRMLMVVRPPRPQVTYAQRRYLVARRAMAAASPVPSWQYPTNTTQALAWHPASVGSPALPYLQHVQNVTQHYNSGASAHYVPSLPAAADHLHHQPADVIPTCSVCQCYPDGASVPLHHLPRTPTEAALTTTIKRKYEATSDADLMYPSKRTTWDYLRHFGQPNGATSWQQMVTVPQACRAY